MIIDMHVAGRSNDGTARDPGAILKLAQTAGLDGLLVVDAEDRGAWRAARKKKSPLVFFGSFVASAGGRFVCVLRDADAEVPARFTSPGALPADAELLDYLKSQKAGVIASEPYDRRWAPTAGDLVFAFEGIHAVEVRTVNSEPLPHDLAREAAQGMHLPSVAGTGDNAPDDEMGQHATLFLVEVGSQEELVTALQSGELWPVQIDRPKGNGGKKRRRRRRKPKTAQEEAASTEE